VTTEDNEQPPPDEAPAGFVPMRGRIGDIAGRLAQGGEPGMTALDRVALELPDGRVVEYAQPLSGVQATARGVAEIRPMSFINPNTGRAICPICLAEVVAMHAAHVPQTALGGVVMTSTCQRCNNDLGSRAEVDLQAWFDGELVDTRIEHDGNVPGRRRIPKVHVRTSADGSDFIMWVDGPSTPEIEEMMRSGTWRVYFRSPDFKRAALAVLKHAYLAACLHLQRIPDTADARAIRHDLVEVRDTPRRQTLGPIEERIVFHRGGVGRQGPPLALVRTTPPGETESRLLISLAGVLFASWPFEEPPHEDSYPDRLLR
jgi:hypothetical protein